MDDKQVTSRITRKKTVSRIQSSLQNTERSGRVYVRLTVKVISPESNKGKKNRGSAGA